MTLDIPVINKDGSLKFTQVVDEKQAQILMQFALNFLVATGLAAAYGLNEASAQEEDEGPQQGELF